MNQLEVEFHFMYELLIKINNKNYLIVANKYCLLMVVISFISIVLIAFYKNKNLWKISEHIF